jgi:DNA-binding response OmpR family regulator
MARILIVEDEASLAGAIQQGLREEHHVVDAVADGKAGLSAVVTGAYDLVVLDLMLPGLDGLELCRRVRAGGHKLPVLILTARDTTDDIVKGLDAGANDYLTKPFAFEEFLARVRALLRGATGQTARLQVGPIILDMTSHRATCDGDELELTAKEYQLLETFMLRAGRVLSKAQLTEILWDWDHEPSSNAIEVHLSSLRKKLESGGAGKLVRTIRGRGYVLEERLS